MSDARRLAPGLLGLAVLVVAVVLIAGGGRHPYTVKVAFADAAGLTKDYDVKIDGVPAGTIKKVDLDGQDHAVLTLELDKGAAPIGAGARALARPANLLGEKYIDLKLGDRSRPQPSGSLIPVSRTGSPVELDDVLNTLDAGTRARLRILINEAGTALTGRGADFNALLGVLPPALDRTREVVAEAASDNARLARAITAGERVTQAVDTRHDDLGRMVAGAADALHVVAGRRRDLGATVDAAPAALHELTGTLGDLRTTAGDLVPTSQALRTSARPLQAVLAELPGFSAQVGHTLDDATAVAPSLSRLGRGATPDVRRLGVTAGRLGSFAKDLSPVMAGLDRGVLKDAIGLMHGWSHVIERSDGLGHIFRVRLNVDQELLTSAMTRYLRRTGGARALGHAGARRPKLPAALTPRPGTPAPDATAPVRRLLGHVAPKVARDVTGKAVKALGDVLGKGGPVPGVVLPGLGGSQGPRDAGDGKDSEVLRLFDYMFGS